MNDYPDAFADVEACDANKEPSYPTGITVAIPSTSAEKMKAIVHLSSAIETLAKALVSVNTTVDIRDCWITGAKTAILITEPK